MLNPPDDKMPYKTPLRKKGVSETVFAHTVKLCWFTIKFEDIHNEITLKKFCEDFEEIVISDGIWEKVITEFNINCDLHKKDGSIHKPNYDKLFRKDGWINKYEWKKQYPQFKADKLMSSDETERERYIRYTRKMNDEDYDSLNDCYQRKKEEDLNVYQNNKNEETITIINERLRKRNGFDKESTINLNADVTADVKQEILTAEDKEKQLKELREQMEQMAYD